VSLEGATDEASAEALLARHYVDRAAAQVLFADPSRLQRDLLADAAALHLRERLPRATPIDGPAHGVPDQPDVSTQVARVGSRLRLAIPVSNAPSRVQKLGAAGRRGYASIPGRASSPGRRGCRGATGCSCGVSTPSGTPRPPAWSSTSGRKGTARAVGMLGAVATSRCRRAKLSLFVICATTAENCSTRVRAPVGVVSSCPLRIAGMTSIPAIVQRAAQKDLKPSIGRVGVSVLFMKFHTRYDRVAHVE
jgi:hypothetical protein